MHSRDFDKIDREILHLLSKDGRMSLKEIGEKIAEINDGIPLSHVAIRNRILKLTPQYFKIQANLNVKANSIKSVYILLETKDYDTQRKLIEKSRLCPRIVSLETLLGKFNVIIKVIGESTQDVDCFISCVIQSDDMIRNYQILHCNDQIKPKFIPIPIVSSTSIHKMRTPCGQNCAFCSMYKDAVCKGCPSSYFRNTSYQKLDKK